MTWIMAAKLEDCPPGTTLEVVVQDRILALVNLEGKIYALDGICPHQGGPLGQGGLAGSTIICPWHGWQFDVPSGRHLASAALRLEQFDVRIEAGTILVDLDRRSAAGAHDSACGNEH